MKISTEEANKKWIESLGKFRTYVSENNEGSRNMLCFYKWNEKIPPSAKLVQKFREEFTLISKNRNPQQEIKFIEKQEMKSIQKPPAPNRRRRKPSVVVEQTPQSQVGLIRKFLRWLY